MNEEDAFRDMTWDAAYESDYQGERNAFEDGAAWVRAWIPAFIALGEWANAAIAAAAWRYECPNGKCHPDDGCWCGVGR